jgi:hypothetical protein
MMQTVFARELPSSAEDINLSARSTSQSHRVIFERRWGPDVAVTDPNGEGPTLLAWNFEAPGRDYDLWAQYACDGRRPVTIEINGKAIFTRAMVDSTFGPSAAHQAWVYQGRVALQNGANRLAITRAKAIPNIRGVRLTLARGDALPNVAERPIPASRGVLPTLQNEDLYEAIRILTPLVRKTVSAGLNPNTIPEIAAELVKATQRDLTQPLDRMGFQGPLNGQTIRASILVELHQLMRFDVFIETGSYLGTTTEMLAGFEMPVYSCESIDVNYYRAATRLAHRANINLFAMDSRKFLQHYFSRYSSQFRMPFFYLDAHWYGDLPLPEEISLIGQNLDDFVIMVDDFNHPYFPYSFDRYPNGNELTLEFVVPRLGSADKLAFLFPLHPEYLESGYKRGTLVIAPTHLADKILAAGVPLMRHELGGAELRETA